MKKGPAISWTGIPNEIRYHSGGGFRCNLCGVYAYTDDDKRVHQGFHDRYVLREEKTQMSSAAWCDPGDHAFKAGEPGSQSFTGTSMDENGAPIRMEMSACKDHSFRSVAQENPVPKRLEEHTD